MKRLFALAALCVLAMPALAAEPMTDAERDALVAHLERTAARFEKSIGSLTEAQWTFKTAPDRWSASEVAEHIIASEGMLRGMSEPAMKTAASEELLANARKDEMIDKMVVDRSKKFQAPEPLQPSGKYATLKEAQDAFRAERQKTIEFAKTAGDLRLHASEHPVAGALDVYSSIVFLSAHTERHTLQIEELTADASFPK